MPALNSLRLLDVLFKYACGVFSRATCIHGSLHHLATKPCEKCGLMQKLDISPGRLVEGAYIDLLVTKDPRDYLKR
jgi:hypothetical protein